ncbi:hypothetical protein MKEN_01110000 [Mycena kentingensis (nom. inval.)]|nr:hypothetical protein MKEN_01110000 [Mycena kentingensis (nom. inval.)]
MRCTKHGLECSYVPIELPHSRQGLAMGHDNEERPGSSTPLGLQPAPGQGHDHGQYQQQQQREQYQNPTQQLGSAYGYAIYQSQRHAQHHHYHQQQQQQQQYPQQTNQYTRQVEQPLYSPPMYFPGGGGYLGTCVCPPGTCPWGGRH